MSEGKHLLSDLIGRKVTAVRMNEEYLGFETDKGSLVYRVEGDCCSSSYFYDFHGVQKLLDNGPVTEVGDVTRSHRPESPRRQVRRDRGVRLQDHQRIQVG